MIHLPPFFLRRLLLSVLIALAWPAWADERPRRVAGLIERVVVGSTGAEFEAKLDTGATLSSIDATEVTRTRRSGRTWIDFTVVRADGSRVKLSGRLVRHVYIKQAGGTTRRPVVLLELCLGSVFRTVEVNLANRDGLDYDVLVGRNFLGGHFMVDPARVHVLTPKCPVSRAK